MNRLMISLLLVVGTAGFATIGCRSVHLASHVTGSSVSSGVEQGTARLESALAESGDVDPAAADNRWPARWGDGQQRGTIIELDPAESLRPIHLSRTHQFRSTPIEYSDANQLAADIGITRGFKFKAEGPGSFLFVPNPKNTATPDITKDSGKQDAADEPDLAFKFVSATAIEPDDSDTQSIGGADEDHVELQRTWFTFRDAELKGYSQAKGTIVLLPGMFGTPDVIVDGLEKFWYKKGFAVLRMRSHPSRFTEHHEFVTQPGAAVLIGGEVARMNDQRVAEGAYATKAAIDYVHAKRPDTEDKPVVLVGMSGGAMMLPTVHAYAPDLYDGAVLIAGGADFLTIAIRSNYKSWIDAITFDFDPDPNTLGEIDDDDLYKFSQDYLRHAKLDAYHTAQEMHDIPVLILHASTDQAVPAETGDLLYQRLGQPERWTYPIGHELIFAGLPTQVTRINRWISEHVLNDAED